MTWVAYAAVTVLMAVGVALGTMAPASATVLINQPAARVCIGHRFKVGVWYQQSSGGSRRYRVTVRNPHGTVVLSRHGRAPSAHWLFWHVRASQVGTYHTVYRTIVGGKWRPYRATTKAHHC
jgi:hypothetical protein